MLKNTFEAHLSVYCMNKRYFFPYGMDAGWMDGWTLVPIQKRSFGTVTANTYFPNFVEYKHAFQNNFLL